MTALRHAITAACAILSAAALGAGAAAATPGIRYFRSPSNNIQCAIEDGSSARCEILKKDWTPPPKPRTCPVDWGNGVVITSRGSRGTYLCAGDTIQAPPGHPYRVLAYGRSIRVGAIICRSATSGMTCTNPRRHGFTLARERVRLF